MDRLIKAGDFKVKGLKVRGKVVPLDEEPSLFGYMRGALQIVGDIISPIDESWDACR